MLLTLINTHLYLALATFATGLFVYLTKKQFSFGNPFVMIYIHLHLITAITGLFIGDFDIVKFSLFQWLSVLTIVSYILSITRITKGQLEAAKFPMLGAYLGLCIAFAGALNPGRIAGFRFWIKTLKLNITDANNYWTILMVAVTIPCMLAIIYYNIIEFRTRKSNKKLNN